MLLEYRKIAKAVGFISLVYVLPLISRPELLIDWKIINLIAAGFVLLLTQPDFTVKDAIDKNKSDRYSVFFILTAGIISQLCIIYDFGYLQSPSQSSNSILSITGLVTIWSGLLFRFWSIRTLSSNFTSSVQIVKEHQLIISGPYKIVRHPSYTGALLYFYGCAILLSSWIGIIVITITYGIAYWARIHAEEKVLNCKFPEYAEYKMRVAAIIPFVILLNKRIGFWAILWIAIIYITLVSFYGWIFQVQADSVQSLLWWTGQ